MNSEFADEESDKDYPCHDIPGMLRKLADEIENGDVNPFGVVVILDTLEDEDPKVRGLGPGMDSDRTHDLLLSAFTLFQGEDDEYESE